MYTFRIEIRKHFLFLLIASTQNNPEARVAYLAMVYSYTLQDETVLHINI